MAELGNSTSLGELNDTLFGVWSFSRSECITWMIVLCTVLVSKVTLNGLSVIVFLRDGSLRKRHMYLVINLTVADLLAGGFSPFILFDDLITPCLKWEIFLWFPIGNLATILSGLAVFFVLSSLANLAAISLERFHATFRSFKHRLMKKRTFGAAIVAVWFSVGILLAVNFLILSYGVQLPYEFHMYSFLFCCLLIIIVSYASNAANINCKTHPRGHCGVRIDRKLTKTLFIVTSVSLMLSLPNIILKFVAGSADSIPYASFQRTTVPLRFLVHCLFYLNSLVNPICYAFRMVEFKRALFSFLMCRPLLAAMLRIFVLMTCNFSKFQSLYNNTFIIYRVTFI